MAKRSSGDTVSLAGSTAGVLAIELVVYATLVAGYLLVVLRALRPFLLSAAEHHRVLYAFLAVALMLGQGVLLEYLTTLLVGRLRRARRERETAGS